MKAHIWRRPLKWVRNILLGIVGLLVVVVSGAYVFFETSYGKDVLRGQIESRVASTFRGGATIGGLEGNLLTQLALTDVVIYDANKQPAIKVKRLTVKLPLLPLISSELRVDKIIAEELDLLVKKDARGELNLANLQNPTEPSSWNIKLPNVVVTRGHVRFELGGEPVDIDNLEIRVDAALPFAGPIDANVSLAADWRQKRAPIDVAASIHVTDREMRVSSAAIQLADIDVTVTQLAMANRPYAQAVSGVVSIYAPAAAVRSLAKVELPGDVLVLATARADGRLTHVDVKGSLGDVRATLAATANIQAKLLGGTLTAIAPDLASLTHERVIGQGGGRIVFEVDANEPKNATARATIAGWVTANGVRASIDAAIKARGERIVLERSTLVATTADARRVTGGRIPLRGALEANLSASGTLAPRLDLAVSGHANGTRLRLDDVRARAFELRIDAKHVPDAPVGSARITIDELRRGDMRLGTLTVAAGNRPDGKLQVSVRSRPTPAPWLVDLDALVTLGQTIHVDLQRHVVRAGAGSTWKGSGGTVQVTPREIRIANVVSRSGNDRLTADATFVRAGRRTGDFTATLDANVDISRIEKAYRGKVVAHLDVSRTAGKLAGTVDIAADGVSLTQGTFDADLKIDARAGKLVANVEVGTLKAGTAKIAVDVDAPKDLTDTRAWSVLRRSAIRNAQLELARIDLAEIATLVGAEPMSGTIDGEVHLNALDVGGLIRVRGLALKQTKDLGTIDADVRIDEKREEIAASIAARLHMPEASKARFFANLRLAPPERLFDRGAWNRLGVKALRGGSIRAERLVFQPGTLERFGIISDMRGEVSVAAEVEAGLTAVRVALDVHALRGGVLAQPITASVRANLDAKRTQIDASVSTLRMKIPLVTVTGGLPLSLDELRANLDVAKTAPLAMTVTIPRVPAKALLEVLGTSQISGGTLDGTVEIRGTVTRPTAVAHLVGRDITVPSEVRKPTQGIRQITIDGRWDGVLARVAVDAAQTLGGTLAIRATANPDDLSTATVSIQANKVDIAPLVALMPGPAGALGGRLEADLTMNGANPRTARLAGRLHIIDGRIPIAPAVGTLFEGDLRLAVRSQHLDVGLVGKLGRGDIKLTASAHLEGVTPERGTLSLTVRKVQLIGTTEPILSGTIVADVARVDDVWQANVLVNRLQVKVPPSKGTELSPVGAPTDVVFGGEKLHHRTRKGTDVPGIVEREGPSDFKPPSQVEGPLANRAEPDAPVASIKVKIANVFVESEEVRGLVGGNVKVTIAEDKEMGIVGRLSLSRGVLDLFNRRYQVDKANLTFDGSPDPVLDVRITYDFPDVTTITEVRGRMSKPQLVLTSNPGHYTQAELLGFLIGGEPSGDPKSASATSGVASAGATYLGNKIAAPIREALPVDIDVLRYETASATSSAAVTVGTWITDSLFLAYRRHLEARPDENAGQGELEYWIRRRLVLEAVVGDRGVSGLDLLWRRRW